MEGSGANTGTNHALLSVDKVASYLGVVPALDLAEALEATKVYSVAGLLPPETPLIRQRPFRAPHYTISHAGLVV